MITLTLNDIFNAVPALREISSKEFPGSTTFKIARLIRELDKEIQLFEEERNYIYDYFWFFCYINATWYVSYDNVSYCYFTLCY